MVLDEQTVPAVLIDHDALPTVGDLFDLLSIEVTQSEAVRARHIINADEVEDELYRSISRHPPVRSQFRG